MTVAIVNGRRPRGRFDQSVITSLTEISSGTNAPFSSAEQLLVLNLHGSGNTVANSLTQSRRLTAQLSAAASYLTDTTLDIHEQRAGTFDGLVRMNVWVQDRQPSNGANIRESYHMGWTDSPTSELRLWTERRLDAVMDRYDLDSRIHPTKRILTGGSMGGWGTMTYGIRRAHRFAALYPDRCRWRYCETSGRVRIPSWTTAIVPSYDVGSAPNLVAEDGGYSAAVHMDHIAWVSDPDHVVPWIGWACGRLDGYMPFQDHIDAVAAMRAAGRGFAFAWNNGDHGNGPLSSGNDPFLITDSYGYNEWSIGQGYPVFSEHSLDDDPEVDLEGGINIGLGFRNVSESAGAWSCEVRSIRSACTVKVAPYSTTYVGSKTPKDVTITAANTWTAVSFP